MILLIVVTVDAADID